MTKYLLRFYKHGNMRFISHLDLGRLFRRAIKRAEIAVDYSKGFNPHEKINIVQPLSLGFESESEYFEITTVLDYDKDEIKDLLNVSMPIDMEFFDIRVIDQALGNLTNSTAAATYKVKVPASKEEYDRIDVQGFLAQPDITIKKRDKKTKTMVDKSVTGYVYELTKGEYSDGYFEFSLLLKCATNESLNPVNLLVSLYEFSGLTFNQETARVNRIDILAADSENKFYSLFEIK